MEISKELIEVIRSLAPGFIAAWIFYGLTPHPKSTPFERVVQALVLTVIIQGIVAIVRFALLGIGRWHAVGGWSSDSTLLWSLGLSILIGLVLARFANNSKLHDWLGHWAWYDRVRARKLLHWLPKWDWTSRTSYASQWFGAFHRDEKYVVLHLKGSRRIYGYPLEWPDHPDQGHFVLCNAAWFKEDGTLAFLYTVDRILIAVQDVELVEIIKSAEDRLKIDDLAEQTQTAMMSLQKEPENGGKALTTPSAAMERRQEPCGEGIEPASTTAGSARTQNTTSTAAAAKEVMNPLRVAQIQSEDSNG